MSTARKGKIARLPREIRDTVNQMLLDGATAARVSEFLASEGAYGINAANLTNWRQGGYKEWLERQSDFKRSEALNTDHLVNALVDRIIPELMKRVESHLKARIAQQRWYWKNHENYLANKARLYLRKKVRTINSRTRKLNELIAAKS